jgi:hypothetical protein
VSVSYFLLFLCFRKVTQEIFSELDETKAKPPIFTEASRRPKMRRRGARSQVMSTHASVLVDSVGPPSAEVCRTAGSFP